MKLAILSRHAKCYSTLRLVEASLNRGHHVEVLDTSKFSIDVASGRPQLFYRSQRLAEFDAVIPRIAATITHFGTAVVRQFEQQNVFVANSSQGILNSRDKLRALQVLSRHEIAIPPSTYVRDRADVLPAIERVGGAPLIVKLLEGTQGVGVILAETSKTAEAILETMQAAKQNVLLQKFVAESRGRDIRALVVGDRVVAAMRRVATGNEFRSNVHRGGRTEMVELSPADQQIAVRAAQIMGLKLAGVDMLESNSGPQIMEVNSSPGLQGLESCTAVDVAGAMLDYVATHAAFKEIDLRQRLTVSADYGVAEFCVAAGSNLVGKTIDESGLAECDINVLTLYRSAEVVPNPRLKRTLEAGDRLLCFGKLEELKSRISGFETSLYSQANSGLTNGPRAA